MRIRRFGSKKAIEIFDFCSRSWLILLFSLFRFFGRAREERSIFKRSKNENVTISLYRVKIHLPKKLKWGLPGGSREVDFESFLYKKGKETIATQQKPAFHENNCFPTFFNYLLNTNVDNRNQTLGNTPVSETPQSINIV